jgi:hypothetical protein
MLWRKARKTVLEASMENQSEKSNRRYIEHNTI